MAMFVLYCDDSGTDASSDIAVAGCYISTAEQWGHFQRDWEEANRRENFGVFHMADFVAKQAQFREPAWQDAKKRERTIKRLVNIITTRVRFGIATAVVKSAYDEVIPSDLRRRLGQNHYTFAVRHAISLVETWREKFGHTAPVKYIFDRLPKGEGKIADIVAAFKIAASGGSDALRRYGIYKLRDEDGWGFQSKATVIPLQAADIWAYENLRYARDVYFAASDTRANIRGSYRALRAHPSEVKYHNADSLRTLVSRIRGKDRERSAQSFTAGQELRFAEERVTLSERARLCRESKAPY